jgi:hypothetical protein
MFIETILMQFHIWGYNFGIICIKRYKEWFGDTRVPKAWEPLFYTMRFRVLEFWDMFEGNFKDIKSLLNKFSPNSLT